MLKRFDRVIEVVLSHEGGLVDDPHDPGGRSIEEREMTWDESKEDLKKKIIELCRNASNLGIMDIVHTLQDAQEAFMAIPIGTLVKPERSQG